MNHVKVLEIKQSVFANNDKQADELRDLLKQKHVFLLNLMSSPGSGKTTTLRQTIALLKDEFKIGVMEVPVMSSMSFDMMSGIVHSSTTSMATNTGVSMDARLYWRTLFKSVLTMNLTSFPYYDLL